MVTLLELTLAEVQTLKRALNIRLIELRRELARSDDRQYHKDLHEELDRLEGIDRQLEGPMERETVDVA